MSTSEQQIIQKLNLNLAYWENLRQDLQQFQSQTVASISDFLTQHKPETLNKIFVPQEQLPVGTAYEQFIFESHKIPTRENLHDLFNGLCWYRFANTKSRLNRFHMDEIDRIGGVTPRGPVRDAITLLDENGLILICSDALAQAIQNKNWQEVFIERRAEWACSQIQIIGHALLEKLVKPYKAITAHALIISDQIKPEQLDHYLSERLTKEYLASKPFSPIPVMGIPNWHPEQNTPQFYEDTQVFRTARK